MPPKPTLLPIAGADPEPHPLGKIQQGAEIINSPGMDYERLRRLDCYALVYVHSGNGRFRDEAGFTHAVRPGDFFVLFPGYGHAYDSQAGWNETFVLFDGPLFALMEQHGVIDRARPLWRLEPVAYWRRRFQETIAPAADDAGAALGRLGQLFAFILEAVEAHDDSRDPDRLWLRRARREIEATLPGPAHFPTLAQGLGVSYETFRKRFAQLSGESPGHYRDQRLHEQAANLLRKTNLSVSEIAAHLAYCDAFHFSKQFKKRSGLSPRAFREQFWNSAPHSRAADA